MNNVIDDIIDKENILTKEDFDLTTSLELFDILYSCSDNPLDTNIKEWCVIGYEINTDLSKRYIEYILCSYPISQFTQLNTKEKLKNLVSTGAVSLRRDLIVELKKRQIEKKFKTLLSEL